MQGRLCAGRDDLRPRAGQRGITQGVPQPVGVGSLCIFGANVIKSRDRQRIDRRGRKKRVSALENWNDADPAVAIARNRRLRIP